MSELLHKTKPYHRWFMLLLLVVAGVWFYMLEKKLVSPEYILHSPLDDYIPYVPAFIVPYVFWYIYVTLPGIFLFFKDPNGFVKMAVFLALGMAAACTVYMLFPNGQALRPSLKGYREPLIRLTQYIYSKDTPANSAPSIHVIYSVAAHLAISRYNNGRIPKVNGISLVAAALCIVSTVFVKQHSVIDLILGLAVSFLLFKVVYEPRKAAYSRNPLLPRNQNGKSV